MKKCACTSPHKQVTISKQITHKLPKGTSENFIFEKEKVIPKEHKKLVTDYPALLGTIRKKEIVSPKPWHALSEMTAWEFVHKKVHIPNPAKYVAGYTVPHPYYKYSAEVYKENLKEPSKGQEEVIEKCFKGANEEARASLA